MNQVPISPDDDPLSSGIHGRVLCRTFFAGALRVRLGLKSRLLPLHYGTTRPTHFLGLSWNEQHPRNELKSAPPGTKNPLPPTHLPNVSTKPIFPTLRLSFQGRENWEGGAAGVLWCGHYSTPLLAPPPAIGVLHTTGSVGWEALGSPPPLLTANCLSSFL